MVPVKSDTCRCGDSRAFCGDKAKLKCLTTDHRPCAPNERERIHSAGGIIVRGRLGGALAVSRAIGDYAWKQNTKLAPDKQQLIAVPDIVRATLKPNVCWFVWFWKTLHQNVRATRDVKRRHSGWRKRPMVSSDAWIWFFAHSRSRFDDHSRSHDHHRFDDHVRSRFDEHAITGHKCGGCSISRGARWTYSWDGRQNDSWHGHQNDSWDGHQNDSWRGHQNDWWSWSSKRLLSSA